MSGGWIGVDLDGTLAHYTGWKGPDVIGEPVPAMLERVREWIAGGRAVKIFTARACIPEQVAPVREWFENYGLGGLEVTNVKDLGMVDLYDDRCHRVELNTGRVVDEPAAGTGMLTAQQAQADERLAAAATALEAIEPKTLSGILAPPSPQRVAAEAEHRMALAAWLATRRSA